MYLDRSILRLERNSAKSAATVDEPLSDHFQVAPACPPSTVIHMRGGNIWEGSRWGADAGYGYYVEGADADLADADDIDGYTGNFTNANYYIGVLIGWAFAGNDWFCMGGDTEFATAAEAEADVEATAMLAGPWLGHGSNGGLPLCALVLRNNGSTGVNGAVLPIDGVNRGRSYFWKDLRPRHYVTYGGPD